MEPKQNIEKTGSSKLANENLHLQEELKKFMEEVESMQPPTMDPSIYKVPKEYRQNHEKFFEPISIPIGPLHCDHIDNKNSSPQEFKKWNLKNFIGRLEKGSIDKITEAMSGLEAAFRNSYRDIDPKMSGDKLVQIMLLDGCFVMELLLSHQAYDQDALVGNTEKVRIFTLQQDMLKLENQLPFSVLENLVIFARANQTKKDPSFPEGTAVFQVIYLALKFFNITMPENFYTNDRPKHLLEIVMKAIFHENKVPFFDKVINIPDNDDSLNEAKSALELGRHGIKFKAGEYGNPTKLEFKKGCLTIPPIYITESTETLLWNFFIFEMFSCTTRILTSYVVMMDNLINTEKDVEILLNSKILVSKNNDIKSLVNLFNEMSANVNQKDFYFAPLVQSLNLHCRSSCYPVRAYLVRNYYDARWDLLNSILLFILTVTQTLFSFPGLKSDK